MTQGNRRREPQAPTSSANWIAARCVHASGSSKDAGAVAGNELVDSVSMSGTSQECNGPAIAGIATRSPLRRGVPRRSRRLGTLAGGGGLWARRLRERQHLSRQCDRAAEAGPTADCGASLARTCGRPRSRDPGSLEIGRPLMVRPYPRHRRSTVTPGVRVPDEWRMNETSGTIAG